MILGGIHNLLSDTSCMEVGGKLLSKQLSLEHFDSDFTVCCFPSGTFTAEFRVLAERIADSTCSSYIWIPISPFHCWL